MISFIWVIVRHIKIMKQLLGLILAFSCAFAYRNSDEFIDEINSKTNLWKAGRNFHKDAPMRKMMGLEFLHKAEELLKDLPVISHDDSVEIPETFDARVQWPECKTIGVVTDQGACLGCWAIAVANAASDRVCIHSKGALRPVLSARHLMACEPESGGCNGGIHSEAWRYWQEKGLISGGPYNSNFGCQPYTFSPCEHHFHGSKPDCPFEPSKTPECVQTCDNSTIKFEEDLTFGGPYYLLPANETQIQLEIMKNGPITGLIIVYKDFINYKSGVYHRTIEVPSNVHTIRVIGWGVENGTKYWLVVNSWNEDWGDKGLIKIRRGTNEIAIERYLVAGLPKDSLV